jgi:hypothetical protein
MPALVKEIARMNDLLERVVRAKEKRERAARGSPRTGG